MIIWKINKKFFLLWILIFILSPLRSSLAFNIKIYPNYPRQGEMVVVEILNSKARPLNIVVGGEKINFFPWKDKYIALWGVKVNYPVGQEKLEINFADGKKEERRIKILARKKIVKTLSLSQVIGTSSAEITKNIVEENKVLNKISSLQKDALFNESFGLPLVNNKKISDGYGVLRKDGAQEIWHLGVDLDAPKGSIVAAINDGVVVFATSTISYGNTIVINHGGGISSLYLHLSKIFVRENETVRKGQKIGLVGTTGYSTGPHLHFSVKVNGVSIDPFDFIKKVSFLISG